MSSGVIFDNGLFLFSTKITSSQNDNIYLVSKNMEKGELSKIIFLYGKDKIYWSCGVFNICIFIDLTIFLLGKI